MLAVVLGGILAEGRQRSGLGRDSGRKLAVVLGGILADPGRESAEILAGCGCQLKSRGPGICHAEE